MLLSGHSLKPLHIDEMEAPFVRVLFGAATFAAVAMLTVWAIVSDPGLLVLALSAMGSAVMAAWMIHANRENAPLALTMAVPGVIVAVALSHMLELHIFGSLALVFIGTATVVFMRQHLSVLLIGYSFVLLTAQFIWGGFTFLGLIDGVVTVGAFVTASVGMYFVRDRSVDSASRFLNLFERAPVSLWEEDFSKVGEWLEGLRASGVVDLPGYLAANRDALREGMSLIEVVRVNQAAARFLEVDDPNELVGPLRPETFPDDALPSVVAQFGAIWDGEDEIAVEVRHGYTVQGNPLYGLLSWAAPRRQGQLDLSRVIVSVVDVTEMNDVRKSLERSLKSKDELIATVSHELRTPLTTVVGLSSELSDAFDEFSRDEARDLLQMIADQSGEVATIVEDLLVAARAESGSLKIAIAPVDIHLEAKTAIRGLDIEEEVDCHTVGVVPTVMADSGRVRQILRNLLVNAKRYGTNPVRVVVRVDGDYVHVEVRDHGEPIPPEEVSRIFERYYRARQTPGVTASVGLGLTVSRELARLMGGDLTYQHDGESVFTLTLPQPQLIGNVVSA